MGKILPWALAPVLILLLVAGAAEFVRGQATGAPLAALPRTIQDPADNPSTPAKVSLGRLLFWDPILSGSKDVACATCHHPQFGYAENLDISIGVNGVGLGAMRAFASPNSIPFVKRNSQTILNVAFNGISPEGIYRPSSAPMFWDLRAKGLEAQSLEPIKTLEEMRGHAYSQELAVDVVVARLAAIPEYRTLFGRAFAGAQGVGNNQSVNADNLAKALAAFQRSIIANNAPFDRYMRGDTSAMTRAQVRGMREFQSVGCVNCHSGPMFSDYRLHVLGIPDNGKLPQSDTGMDHSYAFRTASLRNLSYTAPYMHSGVFADLEDVLDFYDDGVRRPENRNVRRDQLDPLLRRLDDVDDAEDDIIEFLGALSDPSFDKTILSRVPSGLSPGGRIQ